MRHLLTSILALLLLPAALPHANAALLVEEPFDYPEGSILPDFASGRPLIATQPASLGGTGLTHQPKPLPGRLPLDIAKSGLSYTDAQRHVLRTSGLAAAIPEGGSTFFNLYDTGLDDPFAGLRNPNDPRELGNAGKVVWVSFLMMAAGEPAPPHKFLILFTGSKTSIPIGLLNRSSSGSPTIGAVSTTGRVVVEPDRTYLVVLRFVLGETGEAELWIDPNLGGERPDAEPNTHFKKFPVFLRSLAFNKQTGDELPVIFDELRVGETYSDVAPPL